MRAARTPRRDPSGRAPRTADRPGHFGRACFRVTAAGMRGVLFFRAGRGRSCQAAIAIHCNFPDVPGGGGEEGLPSLPFAPAMRSGDPEITTGAHPQDPARSRWILMRHEGRHGGLFQHVARRPAKDRLAEARMTIGAHHHHVGVHVGDMAQEHVRHARQRL